MKISLNWLTDYVDVSSLPAEKLAEMLTNIGLCCDSVTATDSDVVLDLDVTSNRPDCLGHIGLAREVSAMLGLPLKMPDLPAIHAGNVRAADLTSVQVPDPDLCPRYTARVIRNVKVGASPRWMIERLEAVGLRSVNNIVDITNYVLMEYSQPLHAFDYDKLAGHRIVVRRARPGEQIVSIDGTRCTLTDDMLVIADAEKPVAVAGVMGGLETEIGLSTRNVLLESARFDPMTTRRTARHLMLRSEASYRLERGVDVVALDDASLRACQLMLQLAGGELAEGVVDVWDKPFVAPEVAMRPERCRKVLGIDVGDSIQVGILERLGLSPRAENGRIICRIPSYRGDLEREIDLIEEVARIHGLDKLPTGHSVTHSVVGLSLTETTRHDVRDVLSAAGFDETVSHSFLDDAEGAAFGFASGVHIDARIRKSNNLLRPTVLPSLLRVCKVNQDAGNADASVYELAAVFPPSSEQLPREHVELGLVCQGDVQRVRGTLEAIVAALNPQARLEVAPAEVAGFAAGAAGEVLLGGRKIGTIGLVDQKVLDTYGIEKPLAAAAVEFEPLLTLAGGKRTFEAMPRFPAVKRDLSVVVDQNAMWKEIELAVRSPGQAELEQLEYVGTYSGKQVPAGKKSVTMSLVYRRADGTLRSEQVDELVAQVVKSLGERLSATLRT